MLKLSRGSGRVEQLLGGTQELNGIERTIFFKKKEKTIGENLSPSQ